MSKPAMLQQAESNQASLFLQMGGQGSPWYKELKKIYDSATLSKFFDVTLSALETEAPKVKGSIGLPHGIDARKWLDDESSIPSESYLSTAAVSLTMIQLTQLAYFEQVLQSGWSITDLLKHTKGATGHSQGLISMTFSALGKTGNDYYDALALYMKYILHLGVRAQEAHPDIEPTADDLALANEVGLKDPAPMVAVLGADHNRIAQLVDATNANLPNDKKIYISLYNSPVNRILSSFRSSLLTFYKEHKATLDAEQIKFVFLRTSCPFHSPLMEGAVAPFESDRKQLGFEFKASELQIPVYSFADGNDYRNLSDLCATMTRDLLVSTLHWQKALDPVKKLQPTHIVDFGPGKTSQRLTQDTLKEFGVEIPILGMANGKEFKQFTDAQ